MIPFLKSFGEVIVSSNLRETKGYTCTVWHSLVDVVYQQRLHWGAGEAGRGPSPPQSGAAGPHSSARRVMAPVEGRLILTTITSINA